MKPVPASVRFQAVRESRPGKNWEELFRLFWPSYRDWFLKEGEARRPTWDRSRQKLGECMPELVPLFERLVALAGGGDQEARFLSLYRPTPYLTGCSQAVWSGDEPVLVRNYDYHPALWEGVQLCTRWNRRRVMAMSDCVWGVLDGMNDSGLAVSLSFGGRKVVGDGFGCPLILRYILEFCSRTREACEVLERIPAHMAYNVTVVDRTGDVRTVWLAPDRSPVQRAWPLATNHQGDHEWASYHQATGTREREHALGERLGDPDMTEEAFIEGFLRRPLIATSYAEGYGTLYTAIYRPRSGRMELRWAGRTLHQSFDQFEETRFDLTYPGGLNAFAGVMPT